MCKDKVGYERDATTECPGKRRSAAGPRLFLALARDTQPDQPGRWDETELCGGDRQLPAVLRHDQPSGRCEERARVHGGSNAAVSRAGAAGVEGGAKLVLWRGAQGTGCAARWGSEPGPCGPGGHRMGAKAHREIAVVTIRGARSTPI